MATVIDKNGRVCDAQVVKGILSGQPQLVDEPVRQAVLAYTFAPATLNGLPVAVVYYLTVEIRDAVDETPNPSLQRTPPG